MEQPCDDHDHDDDEPKDECPICYDEIQETNICVTVCGHKFCLPCLFKHGSRSMECPMCRTQFLGIIIREPERAPEPEPEPEPELNYTPIEELGYQMYPPLFTVDSDQPITNFDYSLDDTDSRDPYLYGDGDNETNYIDDNIDRPPSPNTYTEAINNICHDHNDNDVVEEIIEYSVDNVDHNLPTNAVNYILEQVGSQNVQNIQVG